MENQNGSGDLTTNFFHSVALYFEFSGKNDSMHNFKNRNKIKSFAKYRGSNKYNNSSL